VVYKRCLEKYLSHTLFFVKISKIAFEIHQTKHLRLAGLISIMAFQQVSLTIPLSPLTMVASDSLHNTSPLIHEGCEHLIQVRNYASSDDSSTYRMCEPQILSFTNCGHHLEYHCTIGRSFQAGEIHDFCTFNMPETVTHPNMNPYLLGLCSECRKIIEDHDKLLATCPPPKTNYFSSLFYRIWIKANANLTVNVNMHSWPSNGWTSSAFTRRIPRYHCKECKLDDRSLRKMIREKARELRHEKRRRRLESSVYGNHWDIGM
jgi:hypothetical protein